MQSENFDKKIRDSLSQRPPGDDNPAWDKMEVLLDKHLPAEKKDKRRFFFILFLFLFTGGGAFLIWQTGKGDKNNISAIESQNKNSERPGTITPPDKNATNNTAGIEKKTVDEKTPGNSIDQNNSEERKILPANSLSNNFSNPELTTTSDLTTKINASKRSNNNSTVTENNSTEKINSNSEKDKKVVVIEDAVKTEPNSISTEKTGQVKELQQPNTENKIAPQKPETKESQPMATEKSTIQKPKSKNSFLNNFFFSLSAGPDFSSVDFGEAGEVQLNYGAGLGYNISDKFSIRTGFYAARKVYAAGPEDYNPPYNVSQYYPNLKSIDANCKVYEIPVVIDYTISKNKKRSWFVSTGLSSLLMKEETYDFYFKPNYSPNYITYSKTIHNENQHYFSTLNLSGGYRRNINQRVSLQAEPYVKIALTGIGLGKVDLNSGGVLFSAIIKPFASKK